VDWRFTTEDARIKLKRSLQFSVSMGSFPVAVDTKADGEAPATGVRVAVFGDTRGHRSSKAYQGRLSLGTWTDRDGEARASRRGRCSHEN
jgi:hypothetical protein